MSGYNVISADSHIVEPPDLYESRIEPKFRSRAPRMERHRTRMGREYDAWYLEGTRVGTVGSVMQAGKRFEDPSSIDFLGLWEDVRKAAYEPHAMLEELEVDGVWAACLQPSQGLFWYRLPDGELLSALCRAYNDWIADFCKAAPHRLKGIGMLNVDDVDDASQELERCAALGLAGAFIPVYPLPDRPYTLRQLLQHRAGVANYGALSAYHDAVARNDEGLRWTAVTVDNGDDAKDALDRITVPQDVLGRIAPTALPRSSLIISDEPLSRETNYRTEFIAVLNNQPQGGFVTRRPTVDVPVASGNSWGDGGFGFFPDPQTGNTRRSGGQYYHQVQQGWW